MIIKHNVATTTSNPRYPGPNSTCPGASKLYISKYQSGQSDFPDIQPQQRTPPRRSLTPATMVPGTEPPSGTLGTDHVRVL